MTMQLSTKVISYDKWKIFYHFIVDKVTDGDIDNYESLSVCDEINKLYSIYGWRYIENDSIKLAYYDEELMTMFILRWA